MLADAVVRRLADSRMAQVESLESAVGRVNRIITDDLMVEDKLNEEVREILSKHESDMRMQGVQFHEMFKIVKQKLVRERKLIL